MASKTNKRALSLKIIHKFWQEFWLLTNRSLQLGLIYRNLYSLFYCQSESRTTTENIDNSNIDSGLFYFLIICSFWKIYRNRLRRSLLSEFGVLSNGLLFYCANLQKLIIWSTKSLLQMLMESCHGLPKVESDCIFYNGASAEPLPRHSTSINHIHQVRTNHLQQRRILSAYCR